MPNKRPARAAKAPAFDWSDFLRKFSRDLLKDASIREETPKKAIESGWLGFEGASEAKIAALEKRLGRRLPPSYREFLAASDGWRNCGAFIARLWPCAKVAWFRKRHQDWTDTWCQYDDGLDEDDLTDTSFDVYGARQDCGRFRAGYLRTALEISEVHDGAILLLNPEVIDERGEWEAWFFANWLPGARRYRSFQELMQRQRRSFRDLLKDQAPRPRAEGNVGQKAARNGDTEAAIEALRELSSRGDARARISLAELCAFRGLWEEVLDVLGRFLSDSASSGAIEEIPGDLLRLMGRAVQETGQWKEGTRVAKTAIELERKRDYDDDSEGVRHRRIEKLSGLEKFSRTRGKAVDDLDWPYGKPRKPRAIEEKGQKSRMRIALNMPTAKALRDRGRPGEYAKHRFTWARDFAWDEEMIRIERREPDALSFDDALDVAQALMRRKDADAAWKVIESRIPQSLGGRPEHVAPIVLLVDRSLRKLMTADRCELVLSTPRGSNPRDH